MAHWNHRVVQEKEYPQEQDSPLLNTICEVFYKDDGSLLGYVEAKVRWGEDSDPKEVLARFERAVTYPVLTPEDFPDNAMKE